MPRYWESKQMPMGGKYGKVGSNRTFGIELEVSVAYDYDRLHDETPFGVKRDGSVSGDSLEFVSPILHGNAGLEALDNLLAFADSRKWLIDETCGFHLHMGAENLSEAQLKIVALGYALTEKLWACFIPASREVSRYCGRLPATCLATIYADSPFLSVVRNQSRYTWINFNAYYTHRTLEVRSHAGTLDATAIKNWVRAHLRFVDAVSIMTRVAVQSMFAGKSVLTQYREIESLFNSRDLSEYYRRAAMRHDKALHKV